MFTGVKDVINILHMEEFSYFLDNGGYRQFLPLFSQLLCEN